MKKFDSMKPKFTHVFRVVVILTIVLHIHHMDFTFEVTR
jgi:hypothetical protein